LQLIGSELDSKALALRTYAARRDLPHVWLDADSLAGRSLMGAAGLTAEDLPAAIAPDRMLLRATPGSLAEYLGLAYRQTSKEPADLMVIGAGPAGLAAAVYGASECRDTSSTGSSPILGSRYEPRRRSRGWRASTRSNA
jgi:thioredoxin reductase (NADPH)